MRGGLSAEKRCKTAWWMKMKLMLISCGLTSRQEGVPKLNKNWSIPMDPRKDTNCNAMEKLRAIQNLRFITVGPRGFEPH